jgi:hypothetical protein
MRFTIEGHEMRCDDCGVIAEKVDRRKPRYTAEDHAAKFHPEEARMEIVIVRQEKKP